MPTTTSASVAVVVAEKITTTIKATERAFNKIVNNNKFVHE